MKPVICIHCKSSNTYAALAYGQRSIVCTDCNRWGPRHEYLTKPEHVKSFTKTTRRKVMAKSKLPTTASRLLHSLFKGSL